jgi:hypothetical protein
MKKGLMLWVLAVGLPCTVAAQIGMYQHGSVVRMQMGDCMLARHGMMVAFGPPAVQGQDSCPEYTLVATNVVYVIVGKSSNQLIPLAEIIDFRLHRNELDVRVDDAKRESKFLIKEMVVRSEWERMQRHIEQQMKAAEVREAER